MHLSELCMCLLPLTQVKIVPNGKDAVVLSDVKSMSYSSGTAKPVAVVQFLCAQAQ